MFQPCWKKEPPYLEHAMVFDVSVAMTWLLFLALFPIAFYWLRRAWRIRVKQDFSAVALKRGESPANPDKFAPYAAIINMVGGVVIIFVIVGVLLGVLAYETWSAIAGSTIWMKFIFDFILSRHAHPIVPKKKA
jgi:small-conductance mechanosensitive channel